MNKRIFAVFAGTLFIVGTSWVAYSASDQGWDTYRPGIQAEAQYSQALVMFHRKQEKEAMALLKALTSEEPKYLEALELMALIFKNQKNEKKTEETYRKLIEAAPVGQQGPYFFELGLIFQKKKQKKNAYKAFRQAAEQDFNKAAAYLFMGTIATQDGMLYRAERDFRKAIANGGGDLELAARFQLGLVLLKVGNSSPGLTELAIVKEKIGDNPTTTVGTQLKEPVSKVLSAFDRNQWYGSVNLSSLVDTNISEVPDTTTTNAATSGKETVKFTLVGGVGYMTALTKDFQFVGGYRASVNKNMNTKTQSYQYFNHLPSVFLNYKPIEPLNGGIKIGAILSNQYIDPEFRRYSLTGDFGIFGKWQTSARYQWSLGANYRPSKYYRDWSSGGRNLTLDTGLKITTGSRFLNFELGVTPERNTTHIKTSRYDAMEFRLRNNQFISDKWIFFPEISFKRTKYTETSPRRVDKLWKGKVNGIYRFGEGWSLSGELTYMKNFSTQRLSYQYTRWIYGAGITKAF